MKFRMKFTEYLERANTLLQSEDSVQLTYCALELRRAIELIIWTQFIDAFRDKISQAGMYNFDYPFKLQSQSISKMYELLKKHIRGYAAQANRKVIKTHFSACGDAPYKKDGDVCYIPPELPKSDYRYLSFILHYEKELDHGKYEPDKNKLIEIYERLKFVQENYTYRFLTVSVDTDKIIPNIKAAFNLDDEEFRSLP